MSVNNILLNQNNLTEIMHKIKGPSYDRTLLKSGITHIGVGGFHRAHQAHYLQRLFDQGESLEWGITGVGLMEYDRKMYEVLSQQDGLYTLTLQSNKDTQSEVIGSIIKMILAVDTPSKVIDQLSSPDTKIISLTITEGGYNFNSNTGQFNFNRTDIVHDLQNPDQPKSVFGYLTESFRKRRTNKSGSVTVLSCDNVQHNGDVTKKVILDFVERQDPGLSGWIDKNVSFPNSMVDRITPKTTRETVDFIKDNYGIKDEYPVNCEPFTQWIIEDNFINGRPALEKVGVQFVDDVGPYEEMKLRLLNAGHSVVGIIGAIHGYATIDECVNDTNIAQCLRKYLHIEATPMLSPVEGINVKDYIDTLIDRFSNPNIKDSVGRICSESSAKLPKFILPTILENLKTDGPITLGVFVIASWCYSHGTRKNEKGKDLDIIDEMADQLHSQASKSKENPLAFLEINEVFGDLIYNERFTTEYKRLLLLIYKNNDILKTMQSLI